MNKVSVTIPCFNEKATIEQVVEKVMASSMDLEKEVIIVNDGSWDGTTEVLEKMRNRYDNLRIVHHTENLGRGVSLISALKEATGDIIIIQDGDLEYEPGDYPQLIGPIIEGHADIVYGSRFKTPRPWKGYWVHYFFNKALLSVTRLITKLPVTDALTGYRAFRAEIIKSLALQESRFSSDIELLFGIVADNRHRFVEIPACYAPRTYREGKKIGVSDAFDIIRFIINHVVWGSNRRL